MISANRREPAEVRKKRAFEGPARDEVGRN